MTFDGQEPIRKPSRHGLPLKVRILLPFMLIQLLLGSAAVAGSVILIRQTLLAGVDERLIAFEQIVVREIKKREFALATFAGFLAYQEANNQGLTPEGEILQNDLYAALGREKISVAFYPANFSRLPLPSLRQLFEHAVGSGKPRFRLSTDIGPTPALSAATPIFRKGQLEKILLLQTPVDRTLLKQLGAPFKIETQLLGTDGQLFTGSNPALAPPQLNPAELGTILSGQRLFKTVRTPQHRQLVYAIPLGNSDIVLLSSELSIELLSLMVNNLATRSGLAICTLLLFGSYAYFQLVRRLLAPLKELRQATVAIGAGELQRRLANDGHGELGQLNRTFNQMLDQIEQRHAQQLESERGMIVASDEQRFHSVLAEKNLEIEASNRELKARIRELSALFKLNQGMIATLDLDVLFERTLATLKEILVCREMALLLYDPGNGELRVRKTLGLDPLLLRGIAFRLNEGITGLAARTQKMQYVRDVVKEERYVNYKGKEPAVGSMVSMPLLFKGDLVGVLNLHKEHASGFNETDLKLIQAASYQLAMAIENVKLYELTRTLANHDDLTGLANRRYFHESLKRELVQAARFETNFSLIMADIDCFKSFNDTYGHLSGDVALRRVASVLLQNTRGSDLVARFGGEEFIILLPKTSKEVAAATADKLRLCIAAEEIPVADATAHLTLSLGVVGYPDDSKDIYELLDLAERALTQAKEAGRNSVYTCTPDLLGTRPTPPAS